MLWHATLKGWWALLRWWLELAGTLCFSSMRNFEVLKKKLFPIWDKKPKPQHFLQNWNFTMLSFGNSEAFPQQEHFSVSETRNAPWPPARWGAWKPELPSSLPYRQEIRLLRSGFHQPFHWNWPIPIDCFSFTIQHFPIEHLWPALVVILI